MFKHPALVLAFIFFILLTIFSFNIPFFWDGIFFSKSADFFYNNSFATLIPPIDFDTGNFPFFGIYMSAFWKIFGKNLIVSHLAILPFLFGIAFEFYKIVSRYFSKKFLFFSIILLCLEPTFLTQSIIMAYDIILLYFYLLSLNLILQNKTKLLWLSLVLLAFSSMRGIVAEFSLLIFFILNKRSENKIEMKKMYFAFSISILFLCLWSIFHFYKTDWALFSPLRKRSDEHIVSFTMFFRQMFYSVWKLLDFGRIFQWVFLLSMTIYYFRKRKITAENKELLLIILVPTIVFILFFSFLSNPIGHRYFLIPIVLMIIGVTYFLSKFKNSKIQISTFLLFCVLLVSGNFWIYPEKYGNGWDCSLKVLPYFSLQKEVTNYIETEKINPKEIATGFPLFNDPRFSYLQNNPTILIDKNSNELSNFKYVLQSNICNDFTQNEINELENKWFLLKVFKKGQIYLKFYSKTKK